MSTNLHAVRIEQENDEWFNRQFPWRGSLPQFINEALAEFRKQYGERPPASDTIQSAMAELARRY